MKKGNHAKRSASKALALAVIMTLLCCVAVSGTLAWLTDTTGPVENTFTVGNIDIELDETENLNLKMVPGNEIAKDPVVTVVGGSEDCWLFVKIEESANLDNFISYAVAGGWTELPGVDGVYYREVAANAANQDFPVLADNKVTVLDTVTKAMMDDITKGDAEEPTLTFTAYAVQKDNFDYAADAWDEVKT